MKYKPYSIESKAIKTYGTTEIFECAGYILPEGEMLNFSYKNAGIRVEDHRTIGQFFKKASGTDAIIAFMKRGNIRVTCHSRNYAFELIKKPTIEQMIRLKEAAKEAKRLNINFEIERSLNDGKHMMWLERSEYGLPDWSWQYDF